MPGRRRTPESAERTRLIVEQRRRRVPVTEIAAKLGITPGRVSQIYSQALKEIPAPSVAVHRTEETLLADDAVRSLMAITRNTKTNPRTRVEAWSAARAWSEHKARLLGLNAPVKVEVSDERRAEVRAIAERIAAARLGELEPGGTGSPAGDPED